MHGVSPKVVRKRYGFTQTFAFRSGRGVFTFRESVVLLHALSVLAIRDVRTQLKSAVNMAVCNCCCAPHNVAAKLLVTFPLWICLQILVNSSTRTAVHVLRIYCITVVAQAVLLVWGSLRLARPIYTARSHSPLDGRGFQHPWSDPR